MLDVERLADAVLLGARALIAKELAPLSAANADLRARNDALEVRLAQVEARDFNAPARAAMEAVEATTRAIEALKAAPGPDIPGMVKEAVTAAVGALEPQHVPDVAVMVDEAVVAAVEALDVPRRYEVSEQISEAVSPIAFAIKQEYKAEIERMELALLKAMPEHAEPPDLSGFATQAQLEAVAERLAASYPEAKDYSPDIEAAIDAVRKEIPAAPEPPDLSGYAVKADLEAVAERVVERLPVQKDYGPDIAEAIDALRREIPAAPEPPDISGLATKSDLDAVVERIPVQKDFGPEIEAAVEALRKQIPTVPEPQDLSGLATKAEMNLLAVDARHRDEESLAMEKRLEESIDAARRQVMDAIVIPDAPDLSGFATKDALAAVDAKIMPVPEIKDFGPEIQAVRKQVESIVIPAPIPGREGAGIADVKQNADGELIVKLTTGETFNAGKVRGADGLGFDDMSVEFDGEREMSFAFRKDGRSDVTQITLPAVIDRGVWREGEYKAGDGVTWGGSWFIAQRDTDDKPETSDAWRLAVKRGRDGKDYRPHDDDGHKPVRVGVPKKP